MKDLGRLGQDAAKQKRAIALLGGQPTLTLLTPSLPKAFDQSGVRLVTQKAVHSNSCANAQAAQCKNPKLQTGVEATQTGFSLYQERLY